MSLSHNLGEGGCPLIFPDYSRHFSEDFPCGLDMADSVGFYTGPCPEGVAVTVSQTLVSMLVIFRFVPNKTWDFICFAGGVVLLMKASHVRLLLMVASVFECWVMPHSVTLWPRNVYATSIVKNEVRFAL